MLLLLISLPVSARLIPLGEVAFPLMPANEFIGLGPLAGSGVVVAWLDEDQKVLRARELEADLSERRNFNVADYRAAPPTRLYCPQVARIGQGRLAFTWGLPDPSSGRLRLAYRVMNEGGSARSPIRFVQGESPLLSQGCPHLSGGDTGFVISWYLSNHPISTTQYLRARTFSISGVPTSPPIAVATSEGLTIPPEVVVDRDGGFVAAWTLVTHGDAKQLFLGRFGRDGSSIGRQVRVAGPVRDLIAFTAGPESGSGVIWAVREADFKITLRAQRFDRNLRPASPVQAVFKSERRMAIPTAAVDPRWRTALVVADGNEIKGLELDLSLAPRCGAAIPVNVDFPQGFFRVVASAPGEVVIAGVESATGIYMPKVILRRYRLGACSSAP
jgi:hypothetical protein